MSFTDETAICTSQKQRGGVGGGSPAGEKPYVICCNSGLRTKPIPDVRRVFGSGIEADVLVHQPLHASGPPPPPHFLLASTTYLMCSAYLDLKQIILPVHQPYARLCPPPPLTPSTCKRPIPDVRCVFGSGVEADVLVYQPYARLWPPRHRLE